MNWGRDGCYADWRDIDVLDQPAAYEKPSFTTTLISPDEIYNARHNKKYHGAYGGYGGVQRRSEGVDYSRQLYKQTACNGLRKDTLSTEYIDEPRQESCVSQYSEPKPYQCYPDYEDYRTVPGAAGAKKVGYDAPLEYPSYETHTEYYSKPVHQNYDVTKTCKYDPEYHPYYAPEHDFLEYEPKEPTLIKPTYYTPPKVYGEESYGYVDTPY